MCDRAIIQVADDDEEEEGGDLFGDVADEDEQGDGKDDEEIDDNDDDLFAGVDDEVAGDTAEAAGVPKEGDTALEAPPTDEAADLYDAAFPPVPAAVDSQGDL